MIKTWRTGKTLFTDTWHYVNQVPLRNSDDALMVNWCELVTTAADGKVLFRHAWPLPMTSPTTMWPNWLPQVGHDGKSKTRTTTRSAISTNFLRTFAGIDPVFALR